MKLKSKTKTRRFTLKNELYPYAFKKWADEVIQEIERDELLVYDPKDANALSNAFDENGEELLLSQAKIPISIREWLCVGCQCIRFTDPAPLENAVACYKYNVAEVLCPVYEDYKPEGPTAFIGEILISNQAREYTDEHKFKCIIAHELIHVFDMMRYIVPAFMDWRSFWKYVLGEGSRCDMLQTQFNDKGGFIDSYGEKKELAMIETHWPSQSKIWFDAFRKTNESK